MAPREHERLVLGIFIMVLLIVVVIVVMFILFATGTVPSNAKGTMHDHGDLAKMHAGRTPVIGAGAGMRTNPQPVVIFDPNVSPPPAVWVQANGSTLIPLCRASVVSITDSFNNKITFNEQPGEFTSIGPGDSTVYGGTFGFKCTAPLNTQLLFHSDMTNIFDTATVVLQVDLGWQTGGGAISSVPPASSNLQLITFNGCKCSMPGPTSTGYALGLTVSLSAPPPDSQYLPFTSSLNIPFSWFWANYTTAYSKNITFWTIDNSNGSITGSISALTVWVDAKTNYTARVNYSGNSAGDDSYAWGIPGSQTIGSGNAHTFIPGETTAIAGAAGTPPFTESAPFYGYVTLTDLIPLPIININVASSGPAPIVYVECQLNGGGSFWTIVQSWTPGSLLVLQVYNDSPLWLPSSAAQTSINRRLFDDF